MLHLDVQKRNVGKRSAKQVVNTGKVPGVVYGPKMDPTPIAVDYKKFRDAYNEAGETTLIALDFEGESQKEKSDEDKKDENVVLIRDVQTHPVSRAFRHVDFYQLPLDQEIEISVPVESAEEAPAVKEEGGILVNNLHEVSIKALPKDLIHEITVDLSGLENINDSILVKDLNVSEKVEVLEDPEEVVFTIEEPREEEPEEELEAEEEDLSEIKTEGEEKREEREEEEAAEEVAGEEVGEAAAEEQ